MFELLWLGATGAAAFGGYVGSRRFVRERLRFVDAVHRKSAAWVAGGAAAVAAAPVVAILPVIGGATALLFGVGVGAGVRTGAKDAREGRPLLGS